ncbi:MAG: hypothetical protein ACFFAS_20335 [Promethearchaeota archaeon]
MANEIKYLVLKLDNEFEIGYLTKRLEEILQSKNWSKNDGTKRLQWRDIADYLIYAEPKQRKFGKRIELYDKYEITIKKRERELHK